MENIYISVKHDGFEMLQPPLFGTFRSEFAMEYSKCW